jgi:tRNA U54 and U55 pseudouridine synthase Pus10
VTGGVSELAERVYRRVRETHADCFRIHCAIRAMWVEDVQEILDAATAAEGSDPESWAGTMRRLLGKQVEVTISEEPSVTVVGVLVSFGEDGGVCVREEDGMHRWSWPNLRIRELEAAL